METGEIKLLHYRRQYLLVPKKIDCPFENHHHKVTGKYNLYTHVDLQFCKAEKGEISLYLLGDMFDYRDPSKGNKEIVNDLIVCDLQQLSECVAFYSGRFVVIYVRDNQINLIHDATAARKIYYINFENELWIASQPHLLAKTLHIEQTQDKSKIEFYKSEAFNQLQNASIGNTTCYDDIFQLMPNHFLDVNSFQIKRYWPNKVIPFPPTKEVIEKCSEMIRGYMESIVNRYKVMLPVTAGKDSRMLLAASQYCKDKIFFYLNKDKGLTLKSSDLVTPLKLFKKLKLCFNLLDPYTVIDEDFKAAYFANNPYASKTYLPHIYNYYLNFADRVNLPGNIASAGYELYKHKGMKVTAESLAHLSNVAKYKFAIDYYEKWLLGCKDICSSNNLTLLHMFYWEERMANWGTQVQIDKDIAQEDINPFNSRQLVELFLSVPGKYIERPNFILQREIINYLWPEVLQVPINPGKFKKALEVLRFIGVLDLLQKIKYELSLRGKKSSGINLASN